MIITYPPAYLPADDMTKLYQLFLKLTLFSEVGIHFLFSSVVLSLYAKY
jgi:hypothetical protein